MNIMVLMVSLLLLTAMQCVWSSVFIVSFSCSAMYFQGPAGLGFAIVEGSREGRQGIYVRNITYGGVADKDGRLTVGDQILEVQDKNLQDVHYDKVGYQHLKP